MVILDPEAEDQQVDSVVERITQILAEHGGEVVGVDKWGRRRLAYEIERKAEGIYVVITFTSESDPLAELDRTLSLADEVLRFKVMRLVA